MLRATWGLQITHNSVAYLSLEAQAADSDENPLGPKPEMRYFSLTRIRRGYSSSYRSKLMIWKQKPKHGTNPTQSGTKCGRLIKSTHSWSEWLIPSSDPENSGFRFRRTQIPISKRPSSSSAPYVIIVSCCVSMLWRYYHQGKHEESLKGPSWTQFWETPAAYICVRHTCQRLLRRLGPLPIRWERKRERKITGQILTPLAVASCWRAGVVVMSRKI